MSKTTWTGRLECMQYYATVNAGESDSANGKWGESWLVERCGSVGRGGREVWLVVGSNPGEVVFSPFVVNM